MQTYFLLSPATGRVKIGRSKNAPARVRELQTASPDDVELLGLLDGDRELEFHAQFSDARVRGEWFSLSPALAEFLRTTFHRVVDVVVPVEDRVALAFGTSLYRGDHDEYVMSGYDFLDRVRDARRAEDRARFGDERIAEHPATTHEDEEESDDLLLALSEWWSFVRGYAFLDETEGSNAAVLLLFQKPGDNVATERLCRALAAAGAAADSLGVDLRVAFTVRGRLRSGRWSWEIVGPATIDDEADIWGSERGSLTPIIIDTKFNFSLLGDAWYLGRGLPTPASGGLLVE